MTFTDNGTRVPWEWMPQAMASGVECGSVRWFRSLGNLYRFRRAPVRWTMFAFGFAVGRLFPAAWAVERKGR